MLVKGSEMKSSSRVRLFGTPWTVAYRLLNPQNAPGKNTGVGCFFLLRGIFLTQGLNLSALQADALLSEPPGKPQTVCIILAKTIKGAFLVV